MERSYNLGRTMHSRQLDDRLQGLVTHAFDGRGTLLRFYTVAAACLIMCTAIGKMLTIGRGDKLLAELDPVFQIKQYMLFGATSAMELCTALVIVLSVSERIKHVLITLLTGNFLLYRCARSLLAPGAPCPCLGATTVDLLPFSATQVDVMLFTLSAAFFLTSTTLLLVYRRTHSYSLDLRSNLGRP